MNCFSLKKLRLWLNFVLMFGFLMAYVDFCHAYSYKIRPVSDHLWVELSKKDKKTLNKISVYLSSKEYDKAMELSKSFQNPKIEVDPTAEVTNDIFSAEYDENPFFLRKPNLRTALQNIILWSKYSDLDVESDKERFSFSDLSRFVADNSFYPNIKELRDKVEIVARKSDTPYNVSSQYFKSNPAENLESKMYLIESKERYLKSSNLDKQKDKMVDELRSQISLTWIESSYTQDQMKEYLEKYNGVLTHDDYAARVEYLIWNTEYEQAKKSMYLVDKQHKRYFNNVINILEYKKNFNGHLRDIPSRFRSLELVDYARAKWYYKNNKGKKVIKILKRVVNMKYPNKWWGLRLLYIRELLKKNDGGDAYKIAANNELSESSKKYWEAQWTAGWVALRFMDEPQIAYGHFQKLYDHVKQPVTIARATYWLGMAAQASGNEDLALKWYKEASEYPLYFYGQLAIHKRRALDPLNSDGEIILPKDPEVKSDDAQVVSKAMEVQISYLLAQIGDKNDATKIFDNFIAKADSDGQIALIMRVVSEFNDNEMDLAMSNEAAKKNVFFIRQRFKLIKEIEGLENSALVHAIIKQESGFVTHAVSRVGAIGYMQLMPATAKNVAKDLGIRYNKRKLGTDVSYNIRLGSHYIKQMVDRFDGSKMLAIAAYNAGPHNSERWIREFYDPRKEKDIDKVVDWIELITYSETRNYVQRIMENLIIYKYITNQSS